MGCIFGFLKKKFEVPTRDKTNHTPPPPPSRASFDTVHKPVGPSIPAFTVHKPVGRQYIYGVYTYVYTSGGRYSSKVHCRQALDPICTDFTVYTKPRLKPTYAGLRRPDAGDGQLDAGDGRGDGRPGVPRDREGCGGWTGGRTT